MNVRPHIDRALRVTALVLLVVVVVLGSTEALMRRLFPQPLKAYTPNGLYRATRTPNYKQLKTCVEDGKDFDYTINPLGFRGKSMKTVKKEPGVFRIFFVGASTTENQHLPEERTFPALVEAALAARGAKVEVSNCGIAGHGAARSFALIAHRILQLEPDLIVLLEGENDFMQSLDDERWDAANGIAETEKITFKDWLVTQSRLVAVLEGPKERDTRPFLQKRRKDARAKPYFVPKELDLRRGLPTYEAYIRRTKLLCDDARVPLVFMTQPTLWKEQNSDEERSAMWMSNFLSRSPIHVDPATCRKLMDDYNAVTRRVAGDRLVDIDRAVPSDLSHFYDDAHMTSKGNEVVANAILKLLDEKGLAPAK
ncbi:MAG: SGNH/GDSL hydrolase family protein [Planctomycetota bacterium]